MTGRKLKRYNKRHLNEHRAKKRAEFQSMIQHKRALRNHADHEIDELLRGTSNADA